jgi:tripartite-type tricarboxylate transporter receptor subunit TctC
MSGPHLSLRRPSRRLFVMSAGALVAAPAIASTGYPDRPITMVVGYTPGGGADTFARILGQRLESALRQPVIIENRPGGGQNVGALRVARATADGYTLFMSSSALGVNVSLYESLDYDPQRDFAPVGLFAQSPNVLLVTPSLPARNISELIAYARSRGDALNYSSSGIGSTQHLSAELLKHRATFEAQHVPYRGTAPSLTAVQTGEVAFTFANLPSAQPFLQDRRLRPLAVTSAARVPALSDVPTMAEEGIADFVVAAWYGALAPAATPREVVARLNAAINEIAADPAMRSRLDSVGAEPMSGTPQQFADFLREEIERWRPIIRAANIRAS